LLCACTSVSHPTFFFPADFLPISLAHSAGKLSDDECARLGGAMVITNFTNGTNVVTEGEKGDEFFIISAGDAEVWRDGALVCPLKRGDYFGEVSKHWGRQFSITNALLFALCPPVHF
jgi:hypothetical protein